MPDHMTRAQRSLAMSRVKLRNGPLERSVQDELRRRGLHFRHHMKNLPGSPDIVFPNHKIAVFVDGDFWHGWRLPSWERKLSRFWRDKLRANRRRDQRNFRRLRLRGWKVVRIWQHQLLRNKDACIHRIVHALTIAKDRRRRRRYSFTPR